jgi:VanZ family protein
MKNQLTNRLAKALYFWLPVVVWMLVIFTFSSKPTGVASTIDWQDFFIKKFAHVLVFGFLSVLLYRAQRSYGANRKTAIVTSILVAAFYGLTDEYHQSFIGGRTPRLRDVGFDTIGATLSLFTLWYTSRKLPKKLLNLAASLDIIW